jgi:hypothetical protein
MISPSAHLALRTTPLGEKTAFHIFNLSEEESVRSSLSLLHPNPQNSYIPVRPLLIQHTMSTVPAPDWLPAFQGNVVIAVAAFVVYGARCGFYLRDGGIAGCGLGGGGLVG